MPHICKLSYFDLPRVEGHLLRLSPEDRQQRFSASLSDPAIAAYCRRLNLFENVLLGAFVEGELRGVTQLCFGPLPWTGEAELAVSVERPWQHRGIGGELARRSVILASNRGIRGIEMICMIENGPMRRIALRLDGKLIHLGSQAESRVELAPPSGLSFLAEALSDAHAFYGGCAARLLGEGKKLQAEAAG
ncbi:MAG: hypothetical protein WD489_01260 [Rhodovibrionaceae bacterium]